MKAPHSFNVTPRIPKELEALKEMAYNLWIFWNFDAFDLFRRLDRELWEEVHHNPVLLLGKIRQEKLDVRATDEGYLSQLARVKQEYDRYMFKSKPYDFDCEIPEACTFAYFSMEYGISEALPVYSGGLGILSGDHLKSSSDLNIPLVAVGLLYQQGYFRQYLNNEGWQQEYYEENDFYNMPLQLMRDKKGKAIKIWVPMKDHKVWAQIWKVQVGRINLFMLDTNVKENTEADRKITFQLYSGDKEFRLKQEILLGIGGIRALDALNINYSCCHMNEGHSAFAPLERINLLMKKYKVDYQTAFCATFASDCFTTHTPVPAGNDRFSPQLIKDYFSEYVKELGINVNDLLQLGRENIEDQKEDFCMTVLAIKTSTYCNGVSELHSHVSRKMWKNVFSKLPVDDIPITHITNGVHIPTFISNDMSDLFDRYLGPRWKEDPDNDKVWERIDKIPHTEIWRTHERRRERLVAFVRRKLHAQLQRRGSTAIERQRIEEILNPEALTIGFARRFATYKRAVLLFRDPERLARLLDNEDRPVQIIFAGKAHPQDNEGKKFIKEIIQLCKEEPFRNHIVFLEDYDINVARYMVQGVDVWLNNPRRPLEACGTSGMKSSANGSLNVSIPDGWWCEGYDPAWGWSIGNGEEYEDLEYQDEVEHRALFDILEQEVVPQFYATGRDSLPRQWIEKMKLSMRNICPVFNSNRMLEEYTQKFYLPSSLSWDVMTEKNLKQAKECADWKAKLQSKWDQVQILSISDNLSGQSVGDDVNAQVKMKLGDLTPEDLSVRVYFGPLDVYGEFKQYEIQQLAFLKKEDEKSNTYIFEGMLPCKYSGKMGYAVCVMPNHPNLENPYILDCMKWG